MKRINKNPLISVVVPIYKVEHVLENCIQSIINQTYSNLEIILVDDGSPDSCPEICDRYALTDDRIKVYHKENGGLSDARNYGIDRATGEYIGFVDSDDYIAPDMFQTMVEYSEKYDAGIVCCGRFIVDYDGNIMNEEYCTHKVCVYTAKEAVQSFLKASTINEATWDKLYKRELFNNVRFPVGEINEDLPVIPVLMMKCNNIVHCGHSFYYYRINLNGISKSKYDGRKSIVIRHMTDLAEKLERIYPDLHQEIQIFLGRYSFSALLSMTKRSTKREFYQDYSVYKRCFNRSYPLLIRQSRTSVIDKINMSMMRLNLYTESYSKLKQNIKKILNYR